jgi:hypothetical protein
MCRYSCAYTAKEPRCYDDEYARDCVNQWGEDYTCADGNGDGVVDVMDKNSGCNRIEVDNTLAPLPQIQTLTPTNHPISLAPTPYPSIISVNSTSPTIVMGNITSIAPTVSGNITNAPTIPFFPESPVPTPQPSSGNTDTLGGSRTLSPTVFVQAITEAPVATLEPTPAPTGDEIKCNQECVVYPKDTEPEECPKVTIGTCGGGNRGDGICPFEGYCCR